MKTKKLKLKRWASTIIYLSLVSLVFISVMFVSKILDNKYGEPLNLSFILKDFISNDIPVVSYEEDKVIKPFDSETVTIDINYYDHNSNEETQKKSLILYENTYMPNTGILYTNKEQFSILATLDGKVTKISEEELLGKVIEITHNSSLITTYYSIDNIAVSEGQTIKQGDILGTSGKNNISSTSDNMLLFEVSLNGHNINPENYYQTKIEDLQQ